jgi:hypothetical protein
MYCQFHKGKKRFLSLGSGMLQAPSRMRQQQPKIQIMLAF